MSERVAGCAVVGLVHGLEAVLTILHHPRFRLVAVCDLDERKYAWITGRSRVEDSGSEVAAFPTHRAWVQEIREHPSIGSVAYQRDFSRLLEREDIEAVVLALPDLLHRDFTIAALEAGKHVLCVKPMAATLNGARDIARTADDHPGHYMLGLQLPYSPFARAVLDLVDRGLVGEVRQVRVDHHRQPWRPAHSYKFSPVDGALIKEGVHELDLIYLLGGKRPFRQVAGFGGLDVNHGSTDFEDNGIVILNYEGFRAAFSFSYFRRHPKTSTPVPSFLLVGDQGKIWGSHSEIVLENDREERRIAIPPRRHDFNVHDGYAEMYDAFARMVLDGEEPYSNSSVGLENMLTAYATQLAVMENRVVSRAEVEELD